MPSSLPQLTTAVDKKNSKTRPKRTTNWGAIRRGVSDDSRLKFEATLLQDETNVEALQKLGYFHCQNGDLGFGVLLLTKVIES
jgi:hypothetical protein